MKFKSFHGRISAASNMCGLAWSACTLQGAQSNKWLPFGNPETCQRKLRERQQSCKTPVLPACCLLILLSSKSFPSRQTWMSQIRTPGFSQVLSPMQGDGHLASIHLLLANRGLRTVYVSTLAPPQDHQRGHTKRTDALLGKHVG